MLLVEPVLDPAVEEQAIGRIHRIGQSAATTVHRFVVSATVEENVHKICSARAAAMDMRAAVHRVEAPLTVRRAPFSSPGSQHALLVPPSLVHLCALLCSVCIQGIRFPPSGLTGN